MGEGWENARRRDDGNDWAVFRLAGAGVVRHVELDTSYFVGNAPGWVRLSGCARRRGRGPRPDDGWFDLVPRQRSQPDTRHRFLVGGAPRRSPTCGSTSTPTAGWRGCGSGGDPADA